MADENLPEKSEGVGGDKAPVRPRMIPFEGNATPFCDTQVGFSKKAFSRLNPPISIASFFSIFVVAGSGLTNALRMMMRRDQERGRSVWPWRSAGHCPHRSRASDRVGAVGAFGQDAGD